MATYVIGDVQGCFATLQALVREIGFNPAHDRLVLVGDLVNRGPDNVNVLRWARSLGPAVEAVLGNHDLHLLGRAAGLYGAKKRDSVDDVLTAPDRDALLDWLRARPLFLRLDPLPYVVVHAGIMPGLSLDEAADAAASLSNDLRAGGDAELAVLKGYRRPLCRLADTAGDPEARRIAILQGLTLLRTCLADGTPDADFSGRLVEIPPGRRPWFTFEPERFTGTTVLFGHWAALGVHWAPGVHAIDTGCVWGNDLTAFRADDGRHYRTRVRDVLGSRALGRA